MSASEAPAEPTSPSATRRTPRWLRAVTAVEVVIASAAAGLIFLVVLLQAAQRYLPFGGWTWAGELASYGLVWLTFMATGVLVTRNGHIQLQILDQMKSAKLVRGVHVFSLITVAVIGAGFTAACWSLLTNPYTLATPSIGMPMRVIYLIPLLGFLSTTVRAAYQAVQVARCGVPAPSKGEALPVEVNGPRDRGGRA